MCSWLKPLSAPTKIHSSKIWLGFKFWILEIPSPNMNLRSILLEKKELTYCVRGWGGVLFHSFFFSSLSLCFSTLFSETRQSSQVRGNSLSKSLMARDSWIMGKNIRPSDRNYTALQSQLQQQRKARKLWGLEKGRSPSLIRWWKFLANWKARIPRHLLWMLLPWSYYSFHI